MNKLNKIIIFLFFVMLISTNLFDAKFLPSGRLIDVFTLFLILIGAWSFVEAGIRAAIKQPFRKSLSSVFAGVAFITFAYLVNRYSQGVLDWQIVLVLEIIIIGILIIFLYLLSGGAVARDHQEKRCDEKRMLVPPCLGDFQIKLFFIFWISTIIYISYGRSTWRYWR